MMRPFALQVVDLTDETRRLASGLSEAYLHCDERQRDEFLYYLLVRWMQGVQRCHSPWLNAAPLVSLPAGRVPVLPCWCA
jgi:hypothetical protein